MPYKQSIIPLLDEVDPVVDIVGACNNMYLTCDAKAEMPQYRLEGYQELPPLRAHLVRISARFDLF
jgi:hypothetical protein